jgi:hypothetical protein
LIIIFVSRRLCAHATTEAGSIIIGKEGHRRPTVHPIARSGTHDDRVVSHAEHLALTVSGGLCAAWGWTRELLIERRIVSAADLPPHIAWGATLLAVAGAIALVAGIGARLWADPGGFRARRKISALLQRGEGRIAIDMPTAEQNTAVPTATLRRASARSDAKHRSVNPIERQGRSYPGRLRTCGFRRCHLRISQVAWPVRSAHVRIFARMSDRA